MQTKIEFNENLCRTLQELGPVFAAFGRYLASRVDLLPCGLCQDLAAIPDRAAPAPPEHVHEIFNRELGASPDQAFQWFDPWPYESRLFWQSHFAHLAGTEVVVRFARPDIPDWIEKAESIEEVVEMFAASGVKPNRIRTAVSDFRDELALRRSFESDLQSFALLELDSHSSGTLAAVRIYQHLSTPYVLVHERLDPIAGFSPPPSPDQARTLCLTWLRQALEGGVFAVEPHRENLAITPGGRIVFIAGPFAMLPDELKISLGKYLASAAGPDKNAAYRYFAQAVSRSRHTAGSEELRRRFLQTVGFRDGFGNESHAVRPRPQFPPFSEEVLIHWRIAQEYAEPSESVNAFYRGLLHAVATAAAMAPGRDSLLEALHELRVQKVLIDAKELLRPSEMAGLMEQYATTFLAMPADVDRFLDFAASGHYPDGAAQRAQPVARSERYAAAVSLLLGFGALALLLHKVAESVRSPILNHVLAALCVGSGLILLWTGGRLCREA